MKKVHLLLALLCLWSCFNPTHAQNLILNPDFEVGTIPTANNQVGYATNWANGCAKFNSSSPGSPDLFDARSTVCDPYITANNIRVPLNKWANRNVRTAGTNRYVGFSSSGNANGLQYYGESVLGTLSQTLTANCTYSISFWASAIDGYDLVCYGSPTYMTPSTSNKMEVVLRKSGDCTTNKIVYTSSSITVQNWVQFTSSFTLTAAEAAAGYDRIEFRMNNNWGPDATKSHIVFLDDVSLSFTPMVPAVTGPTAFCDGAPLTFTGSLTGGASSSYYWDIEPCDAAGTVTGPLIWSNWYTGTPGVFTFPNDLGLPCNAYYKVKLAVSNGCTYWIETFTIIHINCNPTANAGADQTICYGTCATLGDPTHVRGISWNWSNGATTQQITPCPQVTTTYTLTTTSTSSGCSSTDNVTITVLNNKPDFSITGTPTNPSYMTVSATPMITSGTPTGFHHMWIIDELDASGSVLQTVNSSDPGIGSCWWTFPGAEVFDGLDATGSTFGLNSSCLPAQGKFKYNTRYRFTRGTWSDACGWQQFSAEVDLEKSGSGIHVTEDVKAPDMSRYMYDYLNASAPATKTFSVYPNPASDVLMVEYPLPDKTTGELQLTDLTGKVLQTVVLEAGTVRAQFNVGRLANGTYLVRLVASGQPMTTAKVIVQH